jgi:hypothetical protein
MSTPFETYWAEFEKAESSAFGGSSIARYAASKAWEAAFNWIRSQTAVVVDPSKMDLRFEDVRGKVHVFHPPKPSIVLRAVDKIEIRCEQAGDWRIHQDGSIEALSAKLSDPRYELLVQLHEMIEAKLCQHRGITDEQVTAFDEMFERERSEGKHSATDEDGDDPRAPYRGPHQFATLVERLMANELGVSWAKYEKEIEALFQ